MSGTQETQMESSIVEGLQNLQVLAAYDFQKMDELVHDLTNALEESTKGKNGERSASEQSRASGSRSKLTRKKKCKKRKSASHNSQGASWQHGNISEASESSLDEALKDYIENIAQQSDSDDLVLSAQRLQSLTSLPSQVQVLSFAESDSVTENISPMRPQRRRRRQFKRMAVDAEPNAEMAMIHVPLVEQQQQQQQQNKPGAGSSGKAAAAGDMMEVERDQSDTLPGKRKRSMKDKSGNNSFDLGVCEDTDCRVQGSDIKPDSGSVTESCSSSISSSESDGLFTNDEGRDGDDEQSDFFHEIGPACGIPGIVPWWEAKPGGASLATEAVSQLQLGMPPVRDPNFDRILNGSFEYMSESSKRSFKARLKMLGKPGREIRAGRRRLKDRRPPFPLSNFLPGSVGQKWCGDAKRYGSTGSAASWHSQSCSTSNGLSSGEHIKRRKKTPPATPTEDPQVGEFVGENAEPIPDSSIGGRLLQSMGWTPGCGLGPEGTGIKQPIMAYKRLGRKGLGSGTSSSTNPAPNPASNNHPSAVDKDS